MIRQYIYKPSEAGLTDWPPGELRLEGIEITTNSGEADVFVCPGNLRIFETTLGSGILDHDKLYRLPYLEGNESRTVFFDVSDNFKTPINLPIIFIRCDVRSWMLPHDPHTLQMAWPVDDFSDCIDLPSGGFRWDVSFQGWLSSDIRIQSSAACRNNSNLKCDIAEYTDFTGYCYHLPEGIRRRAEFRRSMKESRIALCPESIPGVFPYRFFEAMSAGRVPMLVGSDFVRPFEHLIPYHEFCIFVSRKNAHRADEAARNFLHDHTDEQIIEMGKLARKWWSRMLDARRWPELHAMAVRAKLKTLGLLKAEPVAV